MRSIAWIMVAAAALSAALLLSGSVTARADDNGAGAGASAGDGAGTGAVAAAVSSFLSQCGGLRKIVADLRSALDDGQTELETVKAELAAVKEKCDDDSDDCDGGGDVGGGSDPHRPHWQWHRRPNLKLCKLCAFGGRQADGQSAADRPVFCPKIYSPVCTCALKTFPNECTARAEGEVPLFEGKCPPLIAREPPLRKCRSDDDCAAGHECVFTVGDCGAYDYANGAPTDPLAKDKADDTSAAVAASGATPLKRPPFRDVTGFCKHKILCFRSEAFCGCDGRSYCACRPDRPTRSVGPCKGDRVPCSRPHGPNDLTAAGTAAPPADAAAADAAAPADAPAAGADAPAPATP